MNKDTHFGFEKVSTEEKQEKVNSVFTSVAENYDLMNAVSYTHLTLPTKA